MKGGLAFLGVLLIAIALVWVFVWEQRILIAHPGTFWSLIGVLLFLSFWTSASEAAYAVVSTLGDPKSLTRKIQEEATRLEQVAATKEFIENPEKLDNRALKRLVARSRTLQAKVRDDFVGAFACISVFLNAALVAFIPSAYVASKPLPTTHLEHLIARYKLPDWTTQLTGEKWLTFVASTLLILVFGKVVPKMVGFALPYLFTYRLGRLADCVHFLFGWIARGAKFPFLKILEGNNRRFEGI